MFKHGGRNFLPPWFKHGGRTSQSSKESSGLSMEAWFKCVGTAKMAAIVFRWWGVWGGVYGVGDFIFC